MIQKELFRYFFVFIFSPQKSLPFLPEPIQLLLSGGIAGAASVFGTHI